MPSANKRKVSKERKPDGITGISVRGFKSLVEDSHIDVRRLTILAGANNSGKSSILQPLLLFKQTLDAPYDPGPLKISGPNIEFTSTDQIFSKTSKTRSRKSFSVTLQVDRSHTIKWSFKKHPKQKLALSEMIYTDDERQYVFHTKMSKSNMNKVLPPGIQKGELYPKKLRHNLHYKVSVDRFIIGIALSVSEKGKEPPFEFVITPAGPIREKILELIHVPGWRGTPARTYPTTAIRERFPGIFPDYVASILHTWKEQNDQRLADLGDDLGMLNLTSTVDTHAIDDTQVEVRVGRMPHSASQNSADLLSIADVGFGVSQVLPVLVALKVANPGQLVYIEQPELHLHPRAQVALAQLLVGATKRGVRLILETHSGELLLAIQSLVAEGKLAPERVALHWFSRRPSDGVTEITTAGIDEAGSFGDWPQDFGQVRLDSETRYLDAAEQRLLKKKRVRKKRRPKDS